MVSEFDTIPGLQRTTSFHFVLRRARETRVGSEMAAYDYIIVGAGSAGCVLANRLSEDPDTTVCLVEAGPPDSEEGLHIPVAFSKLYRTPFDWDFATEPEPNANNRSIPVPRGRTLGGSRRRGPSRRARGCSAG